MKRRLTLSHLQRHDNECNCLHILTTSGYVWLTWAYPSLIVEYVFLTELVIERCKELIFLWSTPAVDWETVSWHIFVLSRLWLVSHRSVSDSHICFSNGSSSTRDDTSKKGWVVYSMSTFFLDWNVMFCSWRGRDLVFVELYIGGGGGGYLLIHQ
jgi:hypothetical protein